MAGDQPESASEYAELLADLDFYDEDHWRNVMRQYPGAQDAIRKAAAAIRALEAKVRELVVQLGQGGLAHIGTRDDLKRVGADRDRIAAELRGTQTRLSEMAGEVERLQQVIKRQAASARMGMDAATKISAGQLREAARLHAESQPAAVESERAANEMLTAEVARLTAELAAARENEARWLWMFPDDATVSVTERMQRVYRKWDGCDSWNAAVDAARRAGGE